MTDKEKNTWPENSNYILKAIEEIKKSQDNMNNKLDSIEKTMYESSNAQKTICMNKESQCSRNYISAKVFYWTCSFIVAGLISIGVYTTQLSNVLEKHGMKIEILDKFLK